jgi:hypothetical protein
VAVIESGPEEWKPMQSAPRDGTRILVAVSSSEQGPAEVDVVRWGTPRWAGENCWVATDSDPASPVYYADAELLAWRPLPGVLPRLRDARAARDPESLRAERDGSGI